MNIHSPFFAVIAIFVPIISQIEAETILPGVGAIAGGAYLFIRTLRQDNSYDKLVKGLRTELEDQRKDHKEDRERWEQVVANKDAQITRLNQQLREQGERLNASVQSKAVVETKLQILQAQVKAGVEPWDGHERRHSERRDHQDVPPPPPE